MSDQEHFDLPDDCWELIFRSLNRRHFDSVSAVCERFLSITIVDESSIPFLPRLFRRFPAIKSIDLSHFRGGEILSVLRLISTSDLSLESLDLSNAKEPLVDEFRGLGSKMQNLRVLRYSKAPFIGDDVLIFIANCFPCLKERDISSPHPIFHHDVSDLGITTLAMKLNDLRKVNLSGNLSITDASLLSLCEYCEFLRKIAIRHCNSITLRGISSAIRQRPTLTSISLSEVGFRNNNEGAEITPDFVNSLASLKGLTEINLLASVVPNELLCSIAEQGFPLKKFSLKYCCKYTYTGIFHLLSKCQFIQHLDLENNDFLTDNDVVNLSGFLRNLTFVNLNGCQNLTISTFLTLARSCPLLNEIMMEDTKMRLNACQVFDSKDLVVNSQIKTLHLGLNYSLKDKNI